MALAAIVLLIPKWEKSVSVQSRAARPFRLIFILDGNRRTGFAWCDTCYST